MKIREYLYYKSVTLCFMGILLLVIGIWAVIMDIPFYIICMMSVYFAVAAIVWFFISYYIERNRLKRLWKLIDGLEDKYLLGEVLPKPSSILEKQYFEAIKVISRSAVGIAEKERRQKEEYCEYVESWIHEIKTPLTACSLILANDGDIRKVRRELKRADNLTESILYYARMRTAEKDVQIKEFSVRDILDKAVKSQMELLIAAGISVEIDGDFKVYSDDKALLFIIKQLLINSAKYCCGCHVTIKAKDKKIWVEDNGIGIPSHEVMRVTERGFTGTNGRRLGKSTGMGLYIVAKLCERLNININIQSEAGKYTRIMLEYNF